MTYPDAGNWRKPIRSYGGGACVEVASSAREADPAWRKSSASMNDGNCLEAGNAPGRVLVRDTKQDGRGPVLVFGAGAWRSFTADLKR